MRSRKALLGIVLAAVMATLVVLVPGPVEAAPTAPSPVLEATPAPAAADPDPVAFDLDQPAGFEARQTTGLAATEIVVEPTTGRLLVNGIVGQTPTIAVYEPDGSYVGVLETTAATGSPEAVPPVAAYGGIFTVTQTTEPGYTANRVIRWDPATLAVSGQWGDFTRYGPTMSVHAHDHGITWAVFNGAWFKQHLFHVDLTDGTSVGDYNGNGFYDWASGGDRVAAISGNRLRRAYPVTSFGYAETVTPYSGLTGLQLDEEADAFAADPAASVVREWSADAPLGVNWVETARTYPYTGTFAELVLGPAPSKVLAIVTTSSGAPDQVELYQRDQLEPVGSLPLPAGANLQAITADGAAVAFVPPSSSAPGKAVVLPLASTVGAPTTSVVGRAGGATVSVPVAGVRAASATVGGVAAASTPSAAGHELSVVVPQLSVGTAEIEVTNVLGVTSTASVPLQVVELGPYGDVTPFVQRQYADVLGRAATSTEVEAAGADLAAGGLAGQLPADLVRSLPLTGKDAALIRLYRAVFRRLPDTSGYRYWLGRLEGGTTLVRAAATFAGSSEFQRTYGSLADGPFIDLVYQNVLGRAPDPSGRAYWLRKLGSGTSRGTLVAQFSQSSEYVRKTTDLVEQVRLVLAMFDRMPKQVELDHVADLPLEQVAQALLTASQYPTS